MLNFAKATPEELAEYCRRYLPNTEGWTLRYQPQFPVARLINSQTSKAYWLGLYKKYEREEGEKFSSQVKIWLSNPKSMGPLILSSWAPNNSSGMPPYIFLVEDGNHRTAISVAHNKKFAPAIVAIQNPQPAKIAYLGCLYSRVDNE